ncbi:MAG: DNA polymerase III subunit delta [Pseudomonadota bacterium]
MKLSARSLNSHLNKQLASVYLVTGSEVLLVDEALDAIREAARGQGFTERVAHVAERGFDWSELLASSANLSLFGDRRIIEVRLPTGKPGKVGSKALVRYAEDAPMDCLLVVICPKLDRSAASSAWVKKLSAAGAFVPIYPVKAAEFPGWLRTRMRARGLNPVPAAVDLLAERTEGNLLAANQEIEKLLLLQGPGKVNAMDVAHSVADSARFDVFGLSDAALAGDPARALRMLDGVRAEGVEPVLVLWALSRDIRTLANAAWHCERGKRPEAAMAAVHVWADRKPVMGRALTRHKGAGGVHSLLEQAMLVDRAIKTGDGDAWEALTSLVLQLSSPAFGYAA